MAEKEEEKVGGKLLPAVMEAPFGGVSLPMAKEVFKKQKEMVDLANGLLEEEDYAYIVVFLDPADKDEQPKMFASKKMAEDWAKKYEKSTGKKVKVTKTKLKAAWLRLGLHLGITVPPGQEMIAVDKEVQPIGDNMICIKTTGPGYKSVTLLGISKAPDGRIESRVLHSETTAALYWRSTGRTSVRSGACGYTERRFAHKIHDVIAMGETRAHSRAMACLLGFGETTAEEYEEMESESKPKPKEAPKPKGKSEEKSSKKKGNPTKEESPKEEKKNEGDDLAARQKIVKAAADAVGNAKQVLKYFDDWKVARHEKDGAFDAKALMSGMSDESWSAFKTDLLAWVKETSGVEIEA